MNLRDWLIVVGVVIIVGILLDGYRRMRLAKKDSLKMSLEMGGDIESSPLDDGFNPELPGGGARVIRSALDEQALSDKPCESLKTTTEKREPHIVEPDSLEVETKPKTASESLNTNEVDALNVTVVEEPLSADASSRIEISEPTVKLKPKASGDIKKAKQKQVANAGKANKAKSDSEIDQLVIVLNVHSQEGSFPGVEIKKLLEACGLDHGDMSIFHRHEEEDLLSPIQFSVANAVEPGYFDPSTLESIATPGVSFFMSLPGPKNYMKAFDYMLETAQCFARNLKGDLKDQDRSMLTAQTIEHCRQQIKEFERKQLSKSRV